LDEDGDKITILDNEDLAMAYEWGLEQTKSNLKFMITSRYKVVVPEVMVQVKEEKRV